MYIVLPYWYSYFEYQQYYVMYVVTSTKYLLL